MYKQKLNFIVAHNQSTAFPPPIVAEQHCVQIYCTDSHTNPALVVEVTDTKLIDAPR